MKAGIHKSILILLALASTYLASQTMLDQYAHAVDPKNFNPENIISDAVFTNSNTMTASQIQSFLVAKSSVCLKDLKVLSLHDDNNDGLGDEPYGKGTNNKVSAATLIWQAAQLYDINPQVILTTLQKEQGLITRTDCPQWRYNTALGYGCPDTAPCDDSAYGFTRQIDYGVWHFRGFFDDTYPVPPTIPGSKFIAYNPNASCGGKEITIRNKATASLYSYTPYQPNSNTLNAAFGQEVNCGAYGNLNFWKYFSDWFGSTQGTPFFRINNSTAVYMLGSNENYYQFTSWKQLETYGYGKAINSIANYSPSYITNKVNAGAMPYVAKFEGNSVYLIDNGRSHAFPSREMLTHYGYEIGDEALLPSYMLNYYKPSSDMRSIGVSFTGKVYLIANNTKRHFTGPSAYNSGTPAYSTLPGTGLSDSFLSTIPSLSPIYSPGTLVREGSNPAVSLVTSVDGRIIVPSRQIMDAYDYSFRDVRSISSKNISSYTSSPLPLDLVVKSNTGVVYLIGPSGAYRQIPSDLLTTSYGFIDTANLSVLDQRIIQSLKPEGPVSDLVRAKGESTVYIVQQGKKRAIKSREELQQLGYSMDDVTDVHTLFTQRIPSN